MLEQQITDDVRDYYGKVLATNKDLKTNACCAADSMPLHLSRIAAEIHPEVKSKFYGCGSPIPEQLEGKTVLDLGSGSGRDCYLLSKLVGPHGKVIGVDMTDEQLEVARKHQEYHAEAFGMQESNITFVKGFIEDLAGAGIEDESVDLVISNCVINLSPDKHKVFSEIFRVLKPGGELYFSDVFSDRRVPQELATDPVLVGECLGGAMYTEDFRRQMSALGCRDYRVVAKSQILAGDPQIEERIGLMGFWSITLRAFKLDLEDRCEDYGQVAYYLGGVQEAPNAFRLDDHHLFEVGRPVPVCGNTADMLSQSRFGSHFRIEGDKSRHFGLFDCGPTGSPQSSQDVGACC